MYLSQQLEQVTDKRYRRDWRVVWFRVVKNDRDQLAWERWNESPWRSNRFSRDAAGGVSGNVTAQERARKCFKKGVAEMPRVFHGKKVTPSEAAKLTGMASFAAMDFLRETELDHPSIVPVPAKLKVKPTTSAKLAHATAKVAEFDRKLKRLTTLRKKWARRVSLYSRKVEPAEQGKV